MLRKYPRLEGHQHNKGGRKTKDPSGIKRTGEIRARVLPATESIFKKAAGGSENVPTFLDAIAQVINNLGHP